MSMSGVESASWVTVRVDGEVVAQIQADGA